MTTDTTPAAIEALLKDVTEGPWAVMEKGFGKKDNGPTVYAADDELRYIAKVRDSFNITPTPDIANARFIAWCREGVPALAVELAKARADLEAMAALKRNYAELKDSAETELASLRKEVERLREQIRTARAAVAAQIEVDASACDDAWRGLVNIGATSGEIVVAKGLAAYIRAQPHDRTALDAAIRAAKVEAWKEASAVCVGIRKRNDTSEQEAVIAMDCALSILALFEREGV